MAVPSPAMMDLIWAQAAEACLGGELKIYFVDDVEGERARSPEEKMTERRRYKLVNDMTAIIDDNGFGVIENTGKVTSWELAPDFDTAYFLGGIMGEDYDAIAIISAPLGDDELYRYIPLHKETPMAENTDGFRSIDYYNGTPIDSMSDSRIFALVTQEQETLKSLEKVPPGAAVDAHKATVEANISALMAAVNKRHTK